MYSQAILHNSINMFLLPWITLNYKYDQSNMKGREFFGSKIEYVTETTKKVAKLTIEWIFLFSGYEIPYLKPFHST